MNSTAVLTNAATGQPLELAMQRLCLTGQVGPTGAVLTLLHSFKCGGPQPLEAIYVFQLPRGGVIRRFKVKGQGFEIESQLKPRQEARQDYEDGLEAGHLSTLLETSPDGLVSLMVGQLRPGESVVVAIELVCGVALTDSGYRFRFPLTLAPNYHRQAHLEPTARGLKIELPQQVFGDLLLPEWVSGGPTHEIGCGLRIEALGPVGRVSSPSHNIALDLNPDGSVNLGLAAGSAQGTDRDLVIEVTARESTPALFADMALLAHGPQAPDRPRWVALVPSCKLPAPEPGPRRVLFLLDRSGSMEGQRIAQARSALGVCLSALSPGDEFGLLAFNTGVQCFQKSLVRADDHHRAAAATFLASIQAEGGTELMEALTAAVGVLGTRDRGDIFLLTDGEVGETGPIIESLAASGFRVHVLGVGDAAQDRFLAQLARRTGGLQRVANSNQDVATAALELFSAVRQPRQSGVQATLSGEGLTQVQELGTVWDGYPLVITDRGQGGSFLPDTLRLAWNGGDLTIQLPQASPLPNDLLAIVWAGGQVEDLEAALDAAIGPARQALHTRLVDLSTKYLLATRVLSLVAIAKREGDLEGQALRQQVVPVLLPRDRKPNPSPGARGVTAASFQGWARSAMPSIPSCVRSSSPAKVRPPDLHCCLRSTWSDDDQDEAVVPNARRRTGPTVSNFLMNELTLLQADGSVAAPNLELSLIKTMILALAILQQPKPELFQAHLRKMIGFLKGHQHLKLTAEVLATLEAGKVPDDSIDWLDAYQDSDGTCERLAAFAFRP